MENFLHAGSSEQRVSISSLAGKIVKERVIKARKPQEITRLSTSELFSVTKARR